MAEPAINKVSYGTQKCSTLLRPGFLHPGTPEKEALQATSPSQPVALHGLLPDSLSHQFSWGLNGHFGACDAPSAQSHLQNI